MQYNRKATKPFSDQIKIIFVINYIHINDKLC